MTPFSAPGVVWKDVRPSLLTRPAIERNNLIHFGGARADRSDGTEVRAERFQLLRQRPQHPGRAREAMLGDQPQ